MKYFRKPFLTLLGIILISNVAEARTLKIAANLDSEPFIYRNNGIVEGFEVELINEIGRLKGFNVQFFPALFPQVFQELQKKDIDLIGHVYNDEGRRKLYSLTNPHYIEDIDLLTLKEKNIDNPFANGMTFSTLAFSPLEEEFLNAIQKDYPTLKNQSDQTAYLGFKNLFLKKADILMTTNSTVNRFISRYPEYNYQKFSLPDKYQQQIMISFLTLKDNNELTEKINDGLEVLKANGFYEGLKKKYNL